MKLAGQALQRILGSRMGQAMMAPATREAAKSSIPGAVITTGLTALAGGGPGAALATGALDIGLSTAGARLAGKVTPQMLSKVTGQRAANVLAGSKPGEMSTLQNIAMGAGSIGATLATAPMLAGSHIAGMSQQQLQQVLCKVLSQRLGALILPLILTASCAGVRCDELSNQRHFAKTRRYI
jgi:hypothetical protein